MTNSEKSKLEGELQVLNVDPDTRYTIEVLQNAIDRISSRRDQPNIVYNILFEALGKLVPLYSAEDCQRHFLQMSKPDMAAEPDPNKMYANDQIEDLVAILAKDGVSSRAIQDALIDAFIRRLTANPYRDPLEVQVVEDDYLYLERTTARFRDLMEQLYKALNRAVSSSKAPRRED